MNTNSNKLSQSSSPYLLQHSENPVHWQAYSDDLINHPENKQLLIISIGYSACHWCHVMEHESFEDEAVAKIMNDYYRVFDTHRLLNVCKITVHERQNCFLGHK